MCVGGRKLPVEWDCGSENKKEEKEGREDGTLPPRRENVERVLGVLSSHFSFAQDSALAPEFFWSLLEESVSSFSPAETFSSLDVPRSPRHLRSPPNPRCMSAPPTPLCPKEDTHARGEGGRRVLYSFRARSLLGSILITTPRERCRHTPDPSKLRVVRRSRYGLGFSSALLSLAALALARGAVAPRRTVPAGRVRAASAASPRPRYDKTPAELFEKAFAPY